jgi:F0F1-type ATP synthase membrane subunit b/b'
MSGIETVKVIVDAEKEASRIIDDAMTKAAAIRKNIDSVIQEQRQQMLTEAKKEAADIGSRAEIEGKLEADSAEKESAQMLHDLVAKASRRKDATVEKLVTMIMQVEK